MRPPPPETVQLWERAKADPSSLTDDERLRVLERWLLNEFNEKCQAICSHDLDGLLEKAAHSPQGLTDAEAGVIILGVEDRIWGNNPA